MTSLKGIGKFASLALAALLVAGIAGCSDGKDGAPGAAGATGATGPAGPAGPQGPAGTPAPTPPAPTAAPTGDLVGKVTGISIPATGAGLVTVTFELKDKAGLPVKGASGFEFAIAKLVPATASAPAYWQNYVNRSAVRSGGTVRVLRPSGERATATAVSDGVYRYTFCTDIRAAATFKYYGSGTEPTGSCPSSVVGNSGTLTSAAATSVLGALNLAYDANAVHRLTIIARDSGALMNVVQDFVPASLPTMQTVLANQVVTGESCGACHAEDVADRAKVLYFHGGRRYDVNSCNYCHNPGMYDTYASTDTNWVTLDFKRMIHKLHAGATGYTASSHDYTNVHFPQNAPFGGVNLVPALPSGAGAGVMNCRTCHDNQRIAQPASRPAADKAAWTTRISQQACRTCHDGTVATNVDFSNHFGNQTDNSVCTLCHGPTGPKPVAQAHATHYAVPNNPELVPGAKKVAYEISSMTVNASNQPTVTFRILVDGTPLNLKSLPLTTPDAISIGGVNFKLAWSAPMPTPVDVKNGPAIAQPLDWNNFGTTTGRQYWNDSTSLGSTALAYDQPLTVNLSTSGLIAGLTGPDANGWFTTVPGIHPTTPVAFPANSTLRGIAMEATLTINGLALAGDAVVKGVDGTASTLRRQLVDIAKCNTCHERVGFHGSAGRANNPDHCVMCHNAEMSSSNIFAGDIGGLMYSQKPNNYKDMLHSIHAGGVRTTPFNFIRGNRSATSGGQGPHAFQDVHFPARIADCAACHRPGTFGILSNDRYAWSVIDAQPALGTSATFNPALSIRIGPNTAACGACHDGTIAKSHFSLNAGGGVETCALCHGPGKTADVVEMHKR